jgi:hypothetical protein
MVRRIMMPLVAGAVMQVSGVHISAADSSDARQWLMMVRTVNTDPTKDREFNAWYDDIDIPDVLKVPGYWRARRGRTMQLTSPPIAQTAEPQEQGHYVALYNIESSAIDKTIIDMLMATWKMLSEGRDTPLLKVSERAYYHQYAAPYAAVTTKNVNNKRSFVLERFDVDPNVDGHRFNSWYNGMCRKATRDVPGIVRATRYELYRVLMFEPKYAPRFLTLFEIEVDSEEQARSAAELLARFDDEERASQGYVARESTLYTEIKDVRRH